jgi:hypothetical protein
MPSFPPGGTWGSSDGVPSSARDARPSSCDPRFRFLDRSLGEAHRLAYGSLEDHDSIRRHARFEGTPPGLSPSKAFLPISWGSATHPFRLGPSSSSNHARFGTFGKRGARTALGFPPRSETEERGLGVLREGHFCWMNRKVVADSPPYKRARAASRGVNRKRFLFWLGPGSAIFVGRPQGLIREPRSIPSCRPRIAS